MKYLELIKELQNQPNKKILVTGPQRSGTRFCTNVLATDLNVRCIDEIDYNISDFNKLQSMIKPLNEYVVQAPTFSFQLDLISDDIIIIFMMRDVNDIQKSEKRIDWSKNVAYNKELCLKVLGDELIDAKINMDSPISEIKYSVWNKILKQRVKNLFFELDYESLSEHKMWIDKSKRINFKPYQIK